MKRRAMFNAKARLSYKNLKDINHAKTIRIKVACCSLLDGLASNEQRLGLSKIHATVMSLTKDFTVELDGAIQI